MNVIELGVKFKRDTNKNTQELKDKMLVSQKQRVKHAGEEVSTRPRSSLDCSTRFHHGILPTRDSR